MDRDVNSFFGLSYANYLAIPRSILQSMPDKWQHKFVKLLDELDETFAWRRDGCCISFKDQKGVKMNDPFVHYRHQTWTPESCKRETDRHRKEYDASEPDEVFGKPCDYCGDEYNSPFHPAKLKSRNGRYKSVTLCRSCYDELVVGD